MDIRAIGFLLVGLACECGGQTDPYDGKDAAGGTPAQTGGTGQQAGTTAGRGGDSASAGAGHTGGSEQGTGGNRSSAAGDSRGHAGAAGRSGHGGLGNAGNAGQPHVGGAGGAGHGGAVTGLGGATAKDAGADAEALSSAALAGKTFVFWVDREWMHSLPDGARNPYPPEGEFAPVTPEPRYEVTFSNDGGEVTLIALQPDGGSGMSCGLPCTLELSDAGYVRIGGSLIYSGPMGGIWGDLGVWEDDSRIQAEVVQQGSGLPLIYDWRGELRP
jgi:hypothetical protein